MFNMNPITRLDNPEPDIIRVDNTYYMVTTTMHFYPGGQILRSYDLLHWEIVGYLFDSLDECDEEKLLGEKNIYGHGMEAGSLRYHNNKFYVTFYVRGMDKSFLFISDRPEGPWQKKVLKNGYFSGSLLFDDDGRIYIAHGFEKIWISELDSELNGTKEGGFENLILEDKGDNYIGYTGSHFYKINGHYYLFVMQWSITGVARRTQMCFISDSIEGPYEGYTVFCDDNGYYNQGIAQGGIVDAPNGKWFAVLSQNYGAAGRIPVLVPVSFDGKIPVFGSKGKMPNILEIPNGNPYYRYDSLTASDKFFYMNRPQVRLRPQWQFNHKPDNSLWRILPEGGLSIRTGKISVNLTQAQNTLTQKMLWPASAVEVDVDASKINEGDFAGLCALQGCYGLVGITKEFNKYYVVVIVKSLKNKDINNNRLDYLPGKIIEKIHVESPKIRFRIDVDFNDRQDEIVFQYCDTIGTNNWQLIGDKHKIYFRLDHMMGCRFGLFLYSTRQVGGEAVFNDFIYN